MLKDKINIDNENLNLDNDEQVLLSQLSVIAFEMSFQISLLPFAYLPSFSEKPQAGSVL